MGARRKGRIIAFQSLYRYDLSGAAVEDLLDFSWLDGEKTQKLGNETVTFAHLLIHGAIENLAQIDTVISGQLENWDFTRLEQGGSGNITDERLLPPPSEGYPRNRDHR